HTRYYYNILLSIQNAETGSVMAVLPIAFDISVNVNKEKLLFFTTKDSARYEVNLKAITLVQILESTNDENTIKCKNPRGIDGPYLLDSGGNPVEYDKPYYMDPSLL